MLDKFKEKLELYGLYTTCFLVVKALIAKIFQFSWERIVLLSVDPACVDSTLDFPEDITICTLKLADYDCMQWHNFMDEKKVHLYNQRFVNPRAHAYGAFVKGKLASSCWMLEGEILVLGKISIPISDKDVLFFDDYCLPEYRKKGLHKLLNKYRINKAKEIGARKCYVNVYSYNRPALRSQLHCGMQIEKCFYVFMWRNHICCTLKM